MWNIVEKIILGFAVMILVLVLLQLGYNIHVYGWIY
jgi:hypothetical protein